VIRRELVFVDTGVPNYEQLPGVAAFTICNNVFGSQPVAV
jgi:hypothetical protein